MKFSVLGCGRWGSFISWYLADKMKFDTTLYGRETSSKYQQLLSQKQNDYIKLDENIKLTSDLNSAVASAEYIIISISAQALREFVRKIVTTCDIAGKTFILCMKGLELPNCKRLSEVCVEEGIDKDNIAVWLGPGHIQDFTRGIPNCMTIDAYNHDLAKKLAEMLNSELIRFYYGEDIIGSEIGAACKNIMGICAGILDGLGYSTLKGPLMTRGAFEVCKFINAMGGDGYSAYGLTHLGDYETTLFSKFSNNRQYGEQFARNLPFIKLAEGVATSKAVAMKAKELGVDMPITDTVYKVLYEGADPKEELSKLFRRAVKAEKYS